jgi:hypothetical protein
MPGPDVTTPGGCNRENYRALCRAAWLASTPTTGYVQFCDGSIYALTPTTPTEWRIKVIESEDPGCWLNKVLFQRAAYDYVRLASFPTSPTIVQVWTYPH